MFVRIRKKFWLLPNFLMMIVFGGLSLGDVDFSARIQTVRVESNPRYHALIAAFKERTGCPILVNTSFSVRGEPIACTPEDAFRCFMGNELDLLAVGNCLLLKAEQDTALKQDYSNAFELD